jgi:ketosteroid isomerase-like protein
MGSTRSVIDNHLRCFAAGDLDGILADYAADAVLFTPNGPLKSTAAIRSLFAALLAEFGQPGAMFGVEQLCVDGDYGYLLWNATTPANVYEMAMDTFVVRERRIAAQSFAAKVTPRR